MRQARVATRCPARLDAADPACLAAYPGPAFLGCENLIVTEAPQEDSGSGLAPVSDGWFVVNVRDAEWWYSETRGAACWFESEYGDPPVEFAQLGINVTVLEPGQSGIYHAEANQEAFLVLAGECRLLVEGGERALRPWDFFHCPPWTEHAFVGAGDRPCVILMAGARVGPEVRYPVSKLAARHGASVEKETSDPSQVYAAAERFRRARPPYWSRLPWGRS
jgi:quercetin dioxygenase-like cupin family protein